jgi:alkylated DNA repair dioxygenase AlkB
MDKIWLSENSWFIYQDEFISCDDIQFDKLWELNNQFENHEVRIYGKWRKVPRKQGLFCDRELAYKFSGCSVKSKPIPNDTILKDCLNKLKLIVVQDYNAVFCNWYKDGSDYICAHRDDENDLQSGSSIASISFGATRTFRIRDYKTKKIIKDQTLNHGSLFIMGGDFQKEYTHEVPKTKKQITKRINITCRSFK